MEKPKGYDEDFARFWYDDEAEGLHRLPYLRWRQRVRLPGGPALWYFAMPGITRLQRFRVDAWELREAGVDTTDAGALLSWARVHRAGRDAAWPVVLVFSPDDPCGDG